jgi:hypothetical protein
LGFVLSRYIQHNFLLWPVFCLFFFVTFLQAQERSYYPVNDFFHHQITGKFGEARSYGWHTGIDIDGELGEAVYAWRKGTVVSIGRGYNNGYGNMIVIRHADGYVSIYKHLNTINVYLNQNVEGGSLIATIGNTGYVVSYYGDGSHLHFEIIHNNKYIDPYKKLTESRPVYPKIKKTKTISINSEPNGFRVSINGNYAGYTPLEYVISADKNYRVYIEGDENYNSRYFDINWSDNRSSYLIRMTPKSAVVSHRTNRAKTNYEESEEDESDKIPSFHGYAFGMNFGKLDDDYNKLSDRYNQFVFGFVWNNNKSFHQISGQLGYLLGLPDTVSVSTLSLTYRWYRHLGDSYWLGAGLEWGKQRFNEAEKGYLSFEIITGAHVGRYLNCMLSYQNNEVLGKIFKIEALFFLEKRD